MEKEKGKKLLSMGYALVDASNRTKDIGQKSALALVSKKPFKFSVLMLSSDKRTIFKKLERKYPTGRIAEIVHSVKLYYAIRGCIDILPGIYICGEGLNRGLLKHYLRIFLNQKYNEKKIIILPSLKSLFGKKNMADRLAVKVVKKLEKPTIVLKEKHFKRLGLL